MCSCMISLCQSKDALQLKAQLLSCTLQPPYLISSTDYVPTGKSDHFTDLTEQLLEQI